MVNTAGQRGFILRNALEETETKLEDFYCGQTHSSLGALLSLQTTLTILPAAVMLTRLFVLALAASSAVLGSPAQLLVGSEGELAEKWSYSDCGKRISLDLIDAEPELIRCPVPGLPTDIIRLHSLEVSPDPPKPGQNLTVTASGTVLQTIEVTLFFLT